MPKEGTTQAKNKQTSSIQMERHRASVPPYKGIAIILLLSTTLCGCMKNVTHLSFVPINLEGWDRRDTLKYSVDTLNTPKEKGVELLFHTDGYAYTNLTVHLCITQDSTVLYDEEINATLQQSAPSRGIGQRQDYTIPITNLPQGNTTHTEIRVSHQMSDTLLRGVRAVGIRIGSPVRHPGEVIWQVEW